MTFNQLLLDFIQDKRTQVLIAMIVADVVLGISAAVRSGQFQWRQIANYNYSMLVPFVLGYLMVYWFTIWDVADLFGPLWSEIAATVGVGPAVLHLAASISANLQTIRTGAPPPVVVSQQAVEQVKEAAEKMP